MNFGVSALDGNTDITINKDKLSKYINSIPEVRIGDWKIEEIIVNKATVMSEEIECIGNTQKLSRHSGIKAGERIKRLVYKKEVVMSPTIAELCDHHDLLAYHSKGKILINGLGLGIIPFLLDSIPDVNKIVIHEKEQDVIDMVEESLLDATTKISVICCDAFKAHEGLNIDEYNYTWHDIWTDISPSNIPEMNRLKLDYHMHTKAQGCWAEKDCKLMEMQEELLLKRTRVKLI